MIFRVIIKVSYHEAYFDFEDSLSACQFARVALDNSTKSKDQRKLSSIFIKVFNPKENPDEEE